MAVGTEQESSAAAVRRKRKRVCGLSSLVLPLSKSLHSLDKLAGFCEIKVSHVKIFHTFKVKWQSIQIN